MVGIQQSAKEQSTVTLVLNPGQDDYANCAGKYTENSSFIKIRGKPVYHNAVKDRLIFYDGVRWVITSEIYFDAVYRNGATGGFYASQNTQGEAYQANWGPRYSCS